MRRSLLPLLLSAAFLACCGGETTPAGLVVGPGEIHWTVTVAATHPPSATEFEEAVRAMIAGLPRFPQEKGALALTVKGIFDQVDSTATVIVESELRGVEGSVPMEAGVVFSGESESPAAARELARKTVEELGRSLASQFALWGGSLEERLRALQSPEPDEQILAMRLLARDRVTSALSAIAELLSDPRDQVAEAAADAMARMRDERAVPLLIRSIDHKDLRSEVRAIEAMAEIGGSEAAAYLEMTAQGHELSEVRELSGAALKRLKKRNPR